MTAAEERCLTEVTESQKVDPSDMASWGAQMEHKPGNGSCQRVFRQPRIATKRETDACGCDWIGCTFERLAIIAQLPEDWDDEGSPATDPRIVEAARELLDRVCSADYVAVPAPDVCPIPGGGFQFEWKYGRRELELEFIDTSMIYFLTARQTQACKVLASGEYPQRLLGETLRWLEWLVKD